MTDRSAALRRVLAEELPITQHLGIAVESVDPGGATLSLPLAPNRNHQGTMFAGSLNALATLAGWALVSLDAADAGLPSSVVVQDSAIDYLRPVAGDCTARAERPEPAVVQRFRTTLARRGRARLAVAVTIAVGTERVARYRGRYVAFRRSPPD